MQTSVGSKRAADALGSDPLTSLEEPDDAKRGRILSHEEKLERR